jgi:hypothetical protein
MPVTKFQNLVFTAIMVFCMVFCMAAYNSALQNGLSYTTFPLVLRTMWPEAAAAFVLQRFAAGPAVKRLLPRIVDAASAKPLLVSVYTAGLTVFLMAPMMTLFVTLLKNGFVKEVPLAWLRNLAANFLFALCIQVFYVGPFVRLVFRLLFKKRAGRKR